MLTFSMKLSVRVCEVAGPPFTVLTPVVKRGVLAPVRIVGAVFVVVLDEEGRRDLSPLAAEAGRRDKPGCECVFPRTGVLVEATRGEGALLVIRRPMTGAPPPPEGACRACNPVVVSEVGRTSSFVEGLSDVEAVMGGAEARNEAERRIDAPSAPLSPFFFVSAMSASAVEGRIPTGEEPPEVGGESFEDDLGWSTFVGVEERERER